MASNPGQIPAGGKDKISVVVGTKNMGDRSLRKRFTVMTNDPQNPRVDLTIVGTVKGYFKVSPLNVRLIGPQGKDLQQTVRIMPKEIYPFNITSVKLKEGKHIDYQLNPMGKNPRRDGYSLVVRNTRTENGTYRDSITIGTDLKEKPTIRINVIGRILKPQIKADRKP